METAKELKTVHFNPKDIIELTDPMTKQRHLAMVDESGVHFIDYLTDEQLADAKPIYEVLQPEFVGDTGHWSFNILEQGNYETYEKFSGLLEDLFETPAGENELLRCRAAYHAYKTGDCDLNKAVEIGLQADAAAHARVMAYNRLADETLAIEGA